MIFVTVGTHEQGFDRLLKELDKLVEQNLITQEIFAQIGYSTFEPKNFKFQKMISYDEMDKYMKQSKIIITHGGPGSIFHSLQYGKIPIVVPRNPRFNEHVDDHQILFTKKLEKSSKVIGIYEIDNLYDTINKFDTLVTSCGNFCSNTDIFVEKFKELLKNNLNLR